MEGCGDLIRAVSGDSNQGRVRSRSSLSVSG